jgi:DNA-directed RNA polymerase subunit RPC12/RpoP
MGISIEVIKVYDEREGIWYKCIKCNNDIFLPDFDLSNTNYTMNFCPHCGGKIDNIINSFTPKPAKNEV